VVAFVTSLLLGLAGCGAVLLYGRRRPVGAPLTWGEAMVAAAFTFLMFFWWYGVIPHYWLSWADNELGWRTDSYLAIAGKGPFTDQLPGWWPDLTWSWWPLDITMQVVRDMIVVAIYGLGLGLNVLLWMRWQDRAKERPVAIPASRYGRPLVRKG
jgi:hypothetical protein